MRRWGYFALALGLFAVLLTPLMRLGRAAAAPIAGETFTGVSTTADQWTSGGAPGACLTAATSSAAHSIPACSGGPLDTVGNGALRLTQAIGNQSGFAFYNTPIASNEGLNVSFDMYQYGSTSGTGADGISFFLIDGAASPTVPGALGGSLGYSSSGGTNPGLVGGYVGVGFDRYGNFSDSGFGTGGTGRLQNSIAVRGSQASGYKFVTNKLATGTMAVDGASTRTAAKRHVVVTMSTNNIMTIRVSYNDGPLVTELSGLDLNAINGAGTLPATFKFGFAASTGGSNNIHEIRGLNVGALDPSLSLAASYSGTVKQDETARYNATVTAGTDGQSTLGTIDYTAVFPDGVTPSAAAGDGWNCSVGGQTVHCSRPGANTDTLSPGTSAPVIHVDVRFARDARTDSPLAVANTITTPGNAGQITTTSNVNVTVSSSADADMVADSVENAAPNSGDANDDGLADSAQETVTSLPDSLTSQYAVLQSTGGCSSNRDVTIAAQQQGADASYTYPAGLMSFRLTCTPGATATVSMYFYGLVNPALVLRKYTAAANAYTTVGTATFTPMTIAGRSVTRISYQITDGGPLDADGAMNGTIVDPAGPAVLTSAITAPNTGYAGSSLKPAAFATLATLALIGLEIKRSSRVGYTVR